ncbi:MAG: hypothetical protein Q4F29_08715 [Lachnospiraceae bacterium]|nr:hypothetical protein [Lachnospiraceae bacterium]
MHLKSALTAATPDVWSRLDLTVPQEPKEGPAFPGREGSEASGHPENRKAHPGWDGKVLLLERRLRNLGVAAACLCVAAGGGYYYENLQVASVVNIDVNPSLKLSLNRREKVLKSEALNEDGAVLVEGRQLKGKPVTQAVNQVVDSLIENGYLQADGGEHAVLVSVSGSSEKRAEKLKTEVAGEMETALSEKQVCAVVYDQTIQVTKELEELAETYQVSVGKAEFVSALVSENDLGGTKQQEACGRMLSQTMEELSQEIQENAYSVSSRVRIIRMAEADDSDDRDEDRYESDSRKENRAEPDDRGNAGRNPAVLPEQENSSSVTAMPEEMEERSSEAVSAESGEAEDEPAAEDGESGKAADTSETGKAADKPETGAADEAEAEATGKTENEIEAGAADETEGESAAETGNADEIDTEINGSEADESGRTDSSESGVPGEAEDESEAGPESESGENGDESEAESETESGEADEIEDESESKDDGQNPESGTEQTGKPGTGETDEAESETENQTEEADETGEADSETEDRTEAAGETDEAESETEDQTEAADEAVPESGFEIETEESGEAVPETETGIESETGAVRPGDTGKPGAAETEEADLKGASLIIRTPTDEIDTFEPGDMLSEMGPESYVTSNGTQIIFEKIEEPVWKEPVYASQYLSGKERRLLLKGPGVYEQEEIPEEEPFGPGFEIISEGKLVYRTENGILKKKKR